MNIDEITLKHGSHRAPSKGLCVMEAVAYFAGEPHSDRPQCACPVIAAFLMPWNDALPDDDRQQLKRYIPMVVGTRGDAALESRRAWMATDWLVREYTPAWLDLAGLTEQSALLRSFHELTSADTATNIMPSLSAIRNDAKAARAAAGDAARSALQPTVATLQASAHRLLARMIAAK